MSLEFRKDVSTANSTRMIGLPYAEQSMMIYVKPFQYNTITSWTDRQTDGWTESLYQYCGCVYLQDRFYSETPSVNHDTQLNLDPNSLMSMTICSLWSRRKANPESEMSHVSHNGMCDTTQSYTQVPFTMATNVKHFTGHLYANIIIITMILRV